MKITITEQDWELSTSICGQEYNTRSCIISQAIERVSKEKLWLSGAKTWRAGSLEYFSIAATPIAEFFDENYKNKEECRKLIGTEIEFKVRPI